MALIGPFSLINTESKPTSTPAVSVPPIKASTRYRIATNGTENASAPLVLDYATPDAVLAVIPFSNKTSFDHNSQKSALDDDEALSTDPVLLIDKYVTNISIATSKRSHVSRMSVVLEDTDDPDDSLFSKLAPGDWIVTWLTTNQKDADRIRGYVTTTPHPLPANDFDSGLKFCGRINSVRKVLSVEPSTGALVRKIALDCNGFDELDTAIYFDPILNRTDDSGLFWWADLADGFNKFWDAGVVRDVNSSVPYLISIFMGTGPSEHSKRPDDSFAPTSPNTSFLIPTAIGRILGRVDKQSEKMALSYSDILSLIVGIQEYGSYDQTSQSLIKANLRVLGMVPALQHVDVLQAFTPKPMTGKFDAQPSSWTNVPLWSILQTFLNPVVNEMYTCMRVGIDGSISPHLIVRQKPFNTPEFCRHEKNATPFLSLPRWVIDPILVTEVDLIKSNALRVNYVEVRGKPDIASEAEAYVQRANNLPVLDSADIKRSGLFPFIATANGVISNATAGTTGQDDSRLWMAVLADQLIDNHLKLTGSIVCKGIQQPVCEGDNVEFDGVVFHIEQVTHTFTVAPTLGVKDFTTTFSVSEGIRDTGDFVGADKVTANIGDFQQQDVSTGNA